MEQGSPEKPLSSSLEQRKQPRQFNSRQLEKRPRIAEREEQPSFLALLTGIQNSEAQQIGPSFSRAPIFVPFGNSGLNTQQTYSTLNAMMLENPAPLRSMGIQGIRNPTNVRGGINLASGGSNNAQGHTISRLKRKMICQDDIAPNPRSWNSFFGGDQGYNSSIYDTSGQGYTLYDERYQAIGLPVDPHLRIFNAIYGKGNGGST